MKLNWRGRAARIHIYYEEGESVAGKIRALIIMGAALKILGLPLWALVAMAPVVVAAYILAGYAWVHWGWKKQTMEIATIDQWKPLDVWDWHMRVRVYEKFGIETNHFDPTRLPVEVQRVLASAAKKA